MFDIVSMCRGFRTTSIQGYLIQTLKKEHEKKHRKYFSLFSVKPMNPEPTRSGFARRPENRARLA